MVFVPGQIDTDGMRGSVADRRARSVCATVSITWGMLLLAVTCNAAPSGKTGDALKVFRISGKYFRFLELKDKFMTISESCRKTNGRLQCDAYSALRRASFGRLSVAPPPGADPGPSLCLDIGGTPELSHDEHENENMICDFSDGSKTTTGSVHAHALLNDKNKPE